MTTIHRYACELEWIGSTAGGFQHYPREHRASCPPSPAGLRLSSDPAFLGDSELLNPEQLLLAAASSCQMLSFLAHASRAGLEVIAYSDHAEAVMPEDDKPVRITRIALRPQITVVGETDDSRVRLWIDRAHQTCFIANSLKSDIEIEPRIELAQLAVKDDTPPLS